MKANELRIGNYFNVPIKEQSPFRIDAFEYALDTFVKVAQHQTINGTEVHPLTWYGKDLTPIPLTREWLIKFKFEELEKDCRTFFKKGKFKVELSNNGNVYYNRNIFISSVHQLQNLYFALTGEELTFKSE